MLAEVEAVGGEFLGESPSGKDEAQQTQQDSGGSSEANMQHGVKVLAEMCRCRGTVKTLSHGRELLLDKQVWSRRSKVGLEVFLEVEPRIPRTVLCCLALVRW